MVTVPMDCYGTYTISEKRGKSNRYIPRGGFHVGKKGFIMKKDLSARGDLCRRKGANAMKAGKRARYILAALAVAVVLMALVCLFVGSSRMSLSDGVAALFGRGSAANVRILRSIRVPRVLAALIALILLGGIKRIGQVTEKLVPFMAVMYILLALGVVIVNFKAIPGVFGAIIEGAFNPSAVTGGAVGSFFMSMKKGVSRGIFSNEAGLGTGSIAHACADTKKPVKQGFFGIFEVFVDTIVICTLTALVILCSGVSVGYGEAAGAELTISGFTSTYGGWVSIFTAVAMCCFAFSTIIGWGLYGTRCIEFLFGTKANKPFMVVYSLVAIVGATMNLGLMWSIAETFNGLMVIPNLIAVFLLSGVVVKLVKEYFAGEGAASTVKNSREEGKRTFL